VAKIDDVYDALRLNQRFTHYDFETVMVPFEHARALVRQREQQRAAIAADRRLTDEGKVDAEAKAREKARAAITAWNNERMKALDADWLEQRSALLAHVKPADPKRVELMTQHLLKLKPEDLPIFYGSASESEKREMEGASTSIGRVPMTTPRGLEWRTLLDPEMVETAILERAEQANPAAAAKLRELTEVKSMQQTITNVALSEI
jgi:hypothetical protein